MKNGLIIDKNGHHFWWKNNLFHNENGPAMEYLDGHKEWVINGKRHRLDDPAIEYSDGYKAWYYQDQYIECSSQEEFEKYIKRLVLL